MTSRDQRRNIFFNPLQGASEISSGDQMTLYVNNKMTNPSIETTTIPNRITTRTDF